MSFNQNFLSQSMNGLIDIEASDVIVDNLTVNNNLDVTNDSNLLENNQLGSTSLNTHQIYGLMNYNTTLPQCSLYASNDFDLTNKEYVDSQIVIENTNTKYISIIEEIPSSLASTIIDSRLQLNYGLIVGSTLLSNTEISQLDGITSNIQTQINTISTTTETISKNYFNLSLSSVIYPNRLQLNYLTIGKTPSYNFNLDISGSVNFNLNTSPSFIADNIFMMPPVAGFTTPTTNTPTTIFTNISATTELTDNNGNKWKWTTVGSNGLYWNFNANYSLTYYSNSPYGSYYMFNNSYAGNTFQMKKDIGFITSGLYIVSFLSYWGGNGTGNPTAYITLQMGNSTDTYLYNDSQTRSTLIWTARSYLFEVKTNGLSFITWTAGDSAPTGTQNYWTLTNVVVKKYETIRLLDQVGGKTSYIGPSLSKINSANIYDATIYNTLIMNGKPQFLQTAYNNINTLVLNSNFGNDAGSANSNCVAIGATASPYATNFSDAIMIGNFINANAANALKYTTKSISIGNDLINTVGGNNINIGFNNNFSPDISNVPISNFKYQYGNGSVGIGFSIGNNTNLTNDGVGVPRYSVSIGSAQASDNFYGNRRHYSGPYNGFGIFKENFIYNVAIGAGSQFNSWDSYNTSTGCFSLNKIAGQYTVDFARYNSAFGFNSGNRSLQGPIVNLTNLNNCCFFGANSRSNFNNIIGSTAIGTNSQASANYTTVIGCDASSSIPFSVTLGTFDCDTYISKNLNIRGDININGKFNSGYNYIDISNNQFIYGTKNFKTIDVDNLNINGVISSPYKYVDTSSNQFIGGIKKFTSSIASYKYNKDYNTCIGSQVCFLSQNETEIGNSTYIGYQTGYSLGLEIAGVRYSSNMNCFIGSSAGLSLRRSLYNTLVGNGAGASLTGISNSDTNTLIGYGCGGAIENMRNNIIIGGETHSFISTQPNQWNRNVVIGSLAFNENDSYNTQDSVYIGYKTGNFNTNSLESQKNICIGSESSCGGNFNYSVSLTPSGGIIRESNTIHLGDSRFTYKTLLHNSIYLQRASTIIITGNITLNYPLYNFYSFNISTNSTVTLPIIYENTLGNSISWRRVAGIGTTTLSFLPTGGQKIYSSSLTGSTSATIIIGTGQYWGELVPLQETSTTYAWFLIG